MRHLILLASILLPSTTALAQVSVVLEREPYSAAGPEFSAWTLSLVPEDELIIAVDATFEGSLRQEQSSLVVLGDFYGPSIFQDSLSCNGFLGCIPVDPTADSHFLFNLLDFDLPPLNADENDQLLTAAFATINNIYPNQEAGVPIARLVIPNGSSVSYDIECALIDENGLISGTGPLRGTISVPEPTSAVLLLIPALIGRNRRFLP